MTISVDDPSALQRFLDSVRSQSRPLPSSAQVPPASRLSPDVEAEEGEVQLLRSLSQPTNGYHLRRPDASKPSSESVEIDPALPSPPRQGLLPPHNTPRTAPASPHRILSLNDSPDQHPSVVGEAIYEYVQGMKGLPLSESIWAPKHVPHQRSLLRGPRMPSTDLTPVKLVEPNPAINDTFPRMSFKAASTKLRPETADASTQTESIIHATNLTTSSGQTGERRMLPHESRDTLGKGKSQVDDDKESDRDGLSVLQTDALALEPIEAESPIQTFHGQDERPRQILVTKEQREMIIQRLKRQHEQAEMQKKEHIRKKMEGLGMESPTTRIAQDAQKHPESQQFEPLKSPHSPIPITKSSAASSSDSQENDLLTSKLSGRDLLPHERPRYTKLESKANPQSTRAAQASFKRPEQISDGHRSTPKTTYIVTDAMKSSSFLNKWGPKKKQTIFESTTEKVFEGEISSKTLVTRAYSTDSDKTESSDKLVRGGGSATESRGLPGIAKSKGPPNISSSSPVPFKDSTNLPSNAELSGTKSEVEGDRTNQIYFSSWGTLEKRDRPAAQVRTAHLRGLPPGSTTAFVARLVFGGPLEQLRVSDSQTNTTAFIVFLNGADCKKFYDETANGLVYGTDNLGNERVAWVSLGKDVDVLNGNATQWVALGYSRCVKVVPVSKDYEKEVLWQLAAEKRRSVEGIELGNTKGGARYIIFRFAELAHAVQFSASLRRNEEFERCNITFAEDPCAQATGPRIKLGEKSN